MADETLLSVRVDGTLTFEKCVFFCYCTVKDFELYLTTTAATGRPGLFVTYE